MSERDPDVPRLPRGKGLSLTGPTIFRILMFGALLVAVIILQRPCSEAIGNFFQSFDPPPADAGPADKAQPDPYESDYVEIKPGATEEEIKAILEQERQKAEKKAKEKAEERSAPQ